jgi:hypothetical protein
VLPGCVAPRGAFFQRRHAFQFLGWRTRFHIIRSIARPVSAEASLLLAKAA